ncbi:MAG: hypothetical protein KDB61_02595 [Planctomycetes bacterium]|nr:hypothetical protein [Planctomycetota bacterium]
MLRLISLLLLVLCVPFAGCASNPSNGSKSPLDAGPEDDSAPHMFTLLDLRSNQRLTIVSDAWLRSKGVTGGDFVHRRAAFYAQKKSGDELKVKVVSDAIAQGIWQAFEETRYATMASRGVAPQDAGVIQTLEVLLPAGPVHMAARRGMPPEEGQVLRTSVRAFADVYNSIIQLQASESRPTFEGAGDKR